MHFVTPNKSFGMVTFRHIAKIDINRAMFK